LSQAEVAAGRFATVEDVLAAGVAALQEQAEAEQEWPDYVRDLWKERAAAADRGEFSDGTAAEMMARVGARVERGAT
jgi:Arc/MetJ-type ribon-helix-helix transcriptional regulator